MEPALFSPMMADMILILVGAVSIVALIGTAYNYSIIISRRDKILKIEQLERDLKLLQQEIRELKNGAVKIRRGEAAPAAEAGASAAADTQKRTPPEKKMQPEVWRKFVDDYNNLANSMNVPRAAEACDNFVKSHKLTLLVCVVSGPASANGGSLSYETVEQVAGSNYWAWNVAGQPEDFVVVPNPLVPYDEKLHQAGGMKETFASNYETGSFKQIQVKLPACFTRKAGSWKIVQPGVIRLK
ncbi:hypothetical protein SAMN05216582_1031 [Selenomonas ruminantium]|uniref:Uncharacterized protein n=1 Tax=Selenomonas ruminantium TaxID=971 RepID=A0A1M6RXN9_SELRU|nr:hypothetical protein [Selenomonas ruminantium]SHK37098.1 hypothetical protein SAMN05216582_1031 [Selenomonas ruminantium]